MITLSKEEARTFLIHYHGLNQRAENKDSSDIINFFRRVGCVQFDPLNVVGRNADLVLQARMNGYSPEDLQRILYEEKKLIDGWDKMMAIYLASDFPYFHRVRQAKDKEVKSTLKRRKSIEALAYIEDVMELVRKKGPVQSSDIELGNASKGSWGHRKLSSVAMDYLFNIGRLGVHNKKISRKTFDLMENIIPEAIFNQGDPFTSQEEALKWYIKRRVGSVGLLWGKNGGGWIGHLISKKTTRQELLKELVEEGELQEVSIEGIKEIFYIRQEDESLLKPYDKNGVSEVRFLAPLDNLLWDRGMIKELFDFDYSWEVYVPQVKRKFGYYVLPVLYGNDLIGRFEAEHHKPEKPLIIKNWWWEEESYKNKEVLQAIQHEMNKFATYLKAGEVIYNDDMKNLLDSL